MEAAVVEDRSLPVTPGVEDPQFRVAAPHGGRNSSDDSERAPKAVICGECGKETATFECRDCGGEWYCRPCCIIVHSKGRRKTHAQFKEHPVCDICNSRQATIMCEKCDEMYCSTKCAYGAHDGSPRAGSKKRLHQWESLPSEGLHVKRPPHLEHAVDTRGGRNSFGIALTEFTLARFDGIDDLDDDGFDLQSRDQHMNDVDMIDGGDIPLGGRGSHTPADANGSGAGSGRESRDVAAVPADGDAGVNNNGELVDAQIPEGPAVGGQTLTSLTLSSSGAAARNGGGGALTVFTPEEKVQAGKATEAHFATDSPVATSKTVREELHAAVQARNLPAPDLDEVVTLVSSARDVLATSQIGDGPSSGGANNSSVTSVRGPKAAQLLCEQGLSLAPASDPAPERLLMAGMTDKLEAESKARSELLRRQLEQGTQKTKSTFDHIHGWRRWDFISSEPSMFGVHPQPLTVARPLPPLLSRIMDVSSDQDNEFGEITGYESYVPFFERTCGDDAFLLAVAAVLSSNGYTHVKPGKQEEADAETGVFTPRIKGGPVINVVAPGFEDPVNDNRQQRKKALEKADAAAPCPIGNIFLTAFASCERLQELGVATFRFYKPSTGAELKLAKERQLIAHTSPHKASAGVAPPILEPVEHFVTVDSFFPVFEDGRPAFGRTDVPDEFWLALLEKAYATMQGPKGLSSLVGGSPIEPLFALCGGEPTQIQWGLPALDSSSFTTTASGNEDVASPLALRSRTVSLVWWMMQVATHYNLPMCVTKRHGKPETEEENSKSAWYRFESGIDNVERFEWMSGDIVFFAVNHQIDKNLLDAQQYLDDEDDRSSVRSGASSARDLNMSRTNMSQTSFGFGGNAIAGSKEEHRLVKLRQLFNTSRNNDFVPTKNTNTNNEDDEATSPVTPTPEHLLPLWHDGSNKWSDIASHVSGSSGVAAFAQRRDEKKSTTKSQHSSHTPPVGSSSRSMRSYAESALSRKDTGGVAGTSSSMWSKTTRKALQHHVADERLAWMDAETFALKYNTLLIAHNLAQHKHHTLFSSIDMRIPESLIAKSLPHFLLVVEKRELENADEADDRKWAEGIDSQFGSISEILKPPRKMADDLGFDQFETDDAAEDANANDDTTSVASSQVSIAESLADMGTMGSRRSLVLRVTITQPTTRVDPHAVTSSVADKTKDGSPRGLEETQEMLDQLSAFKAVQQPEDLTLYAFRVGAPERQHVTQTTGPKGEPIYSLPVHTRCLVNEIDDPVAIGSMPPGLHQITFEMETNPGTYNLVVAPTRGMGRTDLMHDYVSQAHFSMHICSVRNGENFEVKAGSI